MHLFLPKLAIQIEEKKEKQRQLEKSKPTQKKTSESNIEQLYDTVYTNPSLKNVNLTCSTSKDTFIDSQSNCNSARTSTSSVAVPFSPVVRFSISSFVQALTSTSPTTPSKNKFKQD
ncbi:hypothetical protein HDU92_005216 [Lobulomyces angularis]|nr:hypothetical protein HDU92_005216 [Lobulomyces angularis]